MNISIKSAVFALRIAIGVLFIAPGIALAADETPWQWTDLTDKLTYTHNRPVWSVGYTTDGWFYTDGLDFSKTGQVYRYDGLNNVNVTKELSATGITRVDHIVSDGDVVVFLNKVVARSNDFELAIGINENGAMKFENHSYVRDHFEKNEGVASITGNHGSFKIVTTKGRMLDATLVRLASPKYGRIFEFDLKVSTLPLDVKNVAALEPNLIYSTRVASPADGHAYKPVAVASFVNGWLIAVHDAEKNVTRFFKEKDGVRTEITSSLPAVTYLHALASNGIEAVIAGGQTNTESNVVFTLSYAGASTNVSVSAATLPFKNWNRVQIAHNGTSWMIVNGKDIAQFSGTSFKSQGKTKDYLATISGNPMKKFLAGGAASEAWMEGPIDPGLKSKLMLVSEDSNHSGIAFWTWISPNTRVLGKDGSIAYNLGAWDADGLNKIEIFVNSVSKKTCDLHGNQGNQSCTLTLMSQDYPSGTDLFVSAVVTDATGKTTDTPRSFFSRTDGVTGTQTTNPNAPSTWEWTELESEWMTVDEKVRYVAGGWHASGIQKIDLYVNDALVETCSFTGKVQTQTCQKEFSGFAYDPGTKLVMKARVTAFSGDAAWSQGKTIVVLGTGATTAIDYAKNGAINALSDHGNFFHEGEVIYISAEGNDPDMTSRIEIYVNDKLVKACKSTNITSCAYTYTPGKDEELVRFYAVLYDRYGYATMSPVKEITKQ